ncbi:MAG: O-antigen ligase family protein, partial [Vicinamibacterales bacterium]
MPARLSLERLTKLLLLLWVIAALALQNWLLHASWPQLPLYTVLLTAGLAAASWFDRRSVAVVLGVAYVFPVITRYTRGLQSPFFTVLWLAAVFGVMLPDLLRAPWHLPRRWRIPLVYSALAVAISAVVVLVREIDGVPLLMIDTGAAFWRGGTPPPFTLMWVLHVSITLVVGILWFDWLLGARDLDYERTIVTPLVAGALLLGLTAVYQFFIDDSLMNETVFRVLGRATGTMWDANVAGMIAALWVGGVWLWAERLGGWRRAVVPPAMVILAIALWATGSRTALLAAAIGVAGIAMTQLFGGERLERRRLVLAIGAFVLMAVAVAAFGRFSGGRNAVVRIAEMVEKNSSVGSLAQEIWARNGYGTVAVEMIRQSPVAGVGVGAYHGLAYEFGRRFGYGLPPDNAQNWLRHQIAELGFVGGAGWAVWFFAFAFAVCVPRRGEPSSIWIARGTILAFG